MASASSTLGSSLWPTLDVLLRAEGTLVPLERCFCSPEFAKSRPLARETAHASNGLEKAANGSCFHTHPQETRRVSLQAGLLLSPHQSPLGCVRDPWATLWRDAGAPGHQDSIRITVTLLGLFYCMPTMCWDTERHCEHLVPSGYGMVAMPVATFQLQLVLRIFHPWSHLISVLRNNLAGCGRV